MSRLFHNDRCNGHDEGMYEVSYCNGACLNADCDLCFADRGEGCKPRCVGLITEVRVVSGPFRYDTPSLEDTAPAEYLTESSL